MTTTNNTTVISSETLAKPAVSDTVLKRKLKAFFRDQQALLKNPDIQPAWKKWLDSPAAYLSFAVAHFSSEEASRAAKLAMEAKEADMALNYVGSLLRYMYLYPDQPMKTLAEMFAEHGAMDAEPVLEEGGIAAGYEAETRYQGPLESH